METALILLGVLLLVQAAISTVWFVIASMIFAAWWEKTFGSKT